MLKMKKGNFIVLISILAIVIISYSWIFYQQSLSKGESCIAKVSQYGKVLYEIPLDEVTNTYEIDIVEKNDTHNVLEVSPGSIRMHRSDCPDQICVKRGAISKPGTPIVCLPNGIVIEIIGKTDDIDIIAE